MRDCQGNGRCVKARNALLVCERRCDDVLAFVSTRKKLLACFYVCWAEVSTDGSRMEVGWEWEGLRGMDDWEMSDFLIGELVNDT